MNLKAVIASLPRMILTASPPSDTKIPMGTSLDSAGQKERVSTEEFHVAEFART